MFSFLQWHEIQRESVGCYQGYCNSTWLHLADCLLLFYFIILQDSLSTLQKCKFDHKSEASILFRKCGIFLDALFNNSQISEYSPQKYKGEICLTSSAQISQPTLYFTHSTEFLHSALNFSQEELICVIVNIYNGRLPKPYELFRCHENTTTHQLKLFITRATNHLLTFVILGVNLLRIKLQEVCM